MNPMTIEDYVRTKLRAAVARRWDEYMAESIDGDGTGNPKGILALLGDCRDEQA